MTGFITEQNNVEEALTVLRAQGRRAASGKTGYRIRLLRAHGLIRKLPRARRYRITDKGRQIVTALLLAQHATLTQLNAKAA